MPGSGTGLVRMRPPVTGAGAGYEHSMMKSRFDVGEGRRREVEGPYERIVGENGAFMIDTVTGATLAVPGRESAIAKGEGRAPAA